MTTENHKWYHMFANDYLEKRLRFVAQRLTHFDLQTPDEKTDEVSLAEMEEFLSESDRSSELFLNFYTRTGLTHALEQYGTLARLRSRGFQPEVSFRTMDKDKYLLHITDSTDGAVLVELACRLGSLKAKATQSNILAGEIFEVLVIEWLLLQNPQGHFTTQHPRLPGQQFPGLGIGREIITLLQIMTERLEREAMLAIPAHYHNSVLYNHHFHFFNPAKEAELHALIRDLAYLSLAEASWAIEQGKVIDQLTNTVFVWQPEEMIWAHSARLKDYFAASAYHHSVVETCQQLSYRFAPPPKQPSEPET